MRKLAFTLLLWITVGIATAQPTDSLLIVIDQQAGSLAAVKAYNALALHYLRQDLLLARHYQMEGIAQARQLGNEVYLSSGYVQAISIMHNSGKADSARYYLDLLRQLTEAPANKENPLITANYYASGGLYYKRTGELKKAIAFMQKAIGLSKMLKPESQAGQLMNLGNTYFLLGEYNNAVNSHLQSLSLFEAAANVQGQSFCYQNIGNAFTEMKQYKKALGYVKKSYDIKKQLNDKRGMATVAASLGDIYTGMQNPALAIKHYRDALAIAKQLNLVPEITKAYFNLARAELSAKDTQRAIGHFNQSKLHAGSIADSASMAATDVALFALTKKSIQGTDPETTMLLGIERIRQDGQINKEVDSYKRLADYYAANGNYEKAYSYSTKYHTLADSLHSNAFQLQMKQTEEEYNLDKQEKEIALLKKDGLLNEALIEKQQLFQTGAVVIICLIIFFAFLLLNRYRSIQENKRLLEIEKMRTGIARDLHDDIGSTLTSISILSNVTLQAHKALTDDQASNLQRIKQNATNIMDSMSDIVWAINPNNDTVEKLLYKMQEFTAEVLEPLNIEYEFTIAGNINNHFLSIEKRKDLYLVFKEAINNAAKYSHADKVSVSLENVKDRLTLIVHDDGDGFDMATIHQGNGMQNMLQRGANIGAQVTIQSSKENGTEVKLVTTSPV